MRKWTTHSGLVTWTAARQGGLIVLTRKSAQAEHAVASFPTTYSLDDAVQLALAKVPPLPDQEIPGDWKAGRSGFMEFRAALQQTKRRVISEAKDLDARPVRLLEPDDRDELARCAIKLANGGPLSNVMDTICREFAVSPSTVYRLVRERRRLDQAAKEEPPRPMLRVINGGRS